MEIAKTFTRLIETNSPLGDFYLKIQFDSDHDENNVLVAKVSSYQDLKDAEPVIATTCEQDLDSIMKTVQEVSQSHSVYLMEKEREDVTKFLINRGFKPEYPRIIS